MTVTAPERPVLLPGWIELLTPYGPDAAVFGAPRPRITEDEVLALAASRSVYYRCCQVRGTGLTCWHCAQAGQIAPEPVRADYDVTTRRDAPAMTSN